MGETLTIPSRFNGPPASANGGYAAGLVASLLGGGAEVTLRTPPPLDTALSVAREDGGVSVSDGDTLVAEAGSLDGFEIDVPDAVKPGEATDASKSYAGFRAHAYATCFVCGPAREDGLGIFPGPVEGREIVAAPWIPPPETTDEIVWAALDCPSGWAVDEFSRSGVLLGRIAAVIEEQPTPGEPHVVIGWPTGADGRKRFAGSAIFDADGRLKAYARSTWLVPAEA